LFSFLLLLSSFLSDYLDYALITSSGTNLQKTDVCERICTDVWTFWNIISAEAWVTWVSPCTQGTGYSTSSQKQIQNTEMHTSGDLCDENTKKYSYMREIRGNVQTQLLKEKFV
jgi:hypothetical protein